MVGIVNWLKTEIEEYSACILELKDRFLFLLNLNSVLIEDEERLKKGCSSFGNYYDNDETVIELYDEIIGFLMPFQTGGNTVPPGTKDALVSFSAVWKGCLSGIVACLPSHFQSKFVKGNIQSRN